MEVKKFQEKMNSIQEKIGQDASNLILDDIGELLNDNKEVNEELTSKDKQIEAKNKTIETLQKVNGNLLQQVSMGKEEDIKPEPKQEEKPKYINFKDAFDEKRKFQKLILTFNVK